MQVKTQSSVSMLHLKAGFCNTALLSDANPGRIKKKSPGFGDVAFLHKTISRQFKRIGMRQAFVFKGLKSLKSR